MLHRQGLQIETYDRGPLLEELRQLGAPSAPMSVFSFMTPASKRDVEKHAEYLNAIKGRMNDLFSIVKTKYQIEGYTKFHHIKNLFDVIQEDFNDISNWYTQKAKTVEDAQRTFQQIKNMLTVANAKIPPYLAFYYKYREETNDISTKVEACYAPLDAYIAYLKGFIPKK